MTTQISKVEQVIQQCEYKFNQVSVFSETVQNAFHRESQFAMQALSKNKYLMSVALNNQQSLVSAVINVAAIGISLNPAEKEAYLVPRDGGICLDISYMGLMRLATDTGQISWVQSSVVYEKDHFQIVGLDKQPEHRFNSFDKERGEAVGVYVTAKLASGDYLTDTMTTDEINEIRDKSQGHIAFMAKKARSSIWNDHWGEMAKKTVVKRASKYWPKSERLDHAIYHLNTDAGEGVTDSSMQVSLIEKWSNAAMKVESEEALRKVWTEASKEFAEAKDAEGWGVIKVELISRAADFKEVVSDHS